LITFFRAATYFHLFSVFIVLILLRIVYLIDGLPILNTELEWMLVGERLGNGYSLYSDTWTITGPLSSYVYGFVHFLFGRNSFFYELMALLLVYIQSLFFTLIINRNKVFIERNYLPGLMYAIMVTLSFDANKLSPALLATTFLLFAINSLFKHIDKSDGGTEPVFEVGLFLGIGSLFLYTFPVFLIWAILSLLMFTSVKLHQVLLLLLGYFLPVLVMGLFFYFNNAFEDFYVQWVLKGFGFEIFTGAKIYQTVIVYGLPLIVAILGIIKVFGNGRYSTFQNRKHQIMVLCGIFAGVCYFLADNAYTYELICLAPFLAFFVTGWFIHVKGDWLPELLFMLFAGFVCYMNYLGVSNKNDKNYIHLSEARIDQTSDKSYIKDRFLLITGDRNDEYYLAKPGSAYLNWEASRYDLEHPDIYESLISIQQHFDDEKPEYIIDNEQVFPAIFERVPELADQYVRVEGTRNFRMKLER
jgi:hypothetical protein